MRAFTTYLARLVPALAVLTAVPALHADTTPSTSAPVAVPATGGPVSPNVPPTTETTKNPPPTDTKPPPAAPAPIQLSVSEMQARATVVIDASGEDLRAVMAVREQAKKSKDVIKLNCVNDKLIQLKAELNIQDSANRELQGALATNSDERFALFAQFNSAHDQTLRIREDAKGCIGEAELTKQDSGVEVSAPVIIDDPTQDTAVFGEPVEAPAYASPYN